MSVQFARIGARHRFVPSPPFLRRVVRGIFRSERKPFGDIQVIVVDNKTIRALNRRFLGENGVTDVIAFPYDPPPGPKSNAVWGDIYISAPVARENAERFGEVPRRELVRLVIHGALHLLGYKDGTPRDRDEMWSRQERILNRYLPGPRRDRFRSHAQKIK